MWSAALFFAFEFCVALPDRSAVFTGRMPDLRTVNFSTVTADYFPGKGIVAMGAPRTILASSQFQLYPLPFFWGNNGFMTVFHIVLGNLTFVDLHLFLEKINGQQLWISLCRLHDKLQGKADYEIIDAIITWCKKHVHPYYFLGDPYLPFDEEQKKDADFWDVNVNRLEMYEFTVDRFMKDLSHLYTNTQVMIAFHHIMKKLEIDRKMRISVEGIPELKDILQIDRKQQLVKIREYTVKAIP